MKNQKGITLIELILALGIAGILFGAGLPAFSDLLNRSKISATVMGLHSALQYGRKTAKNDNRKVSVCPTNDGKNCDRDWSVGYMLFIDHDENRQLDDEDELLRVTRIDDESITLRWRAFGVRSSFQWHHTGITNHQNGLFEFCYKDEPKLSRALIISKSGRIRHSEDSNGNDIHENANGEDLSCP